MPTIEEDVRKHGDDIHVLTRNVDKLAIMFEHSEKRQEETHVIMKDLANGVQSLNQRMIETNGLANKVNEMSGDIRALRHDIKNMESLHSVAKTHSDKISALEAALAAQAVTITALEKWREGLHGAYTATRGIAAALWAVFGSGIIALLYFLFHMFIKKDM